MVGLRLLTAVTMLLATTSADASDRFRPVEAFDEALREVWPAGRSPSGSGFPVGSEIVVTAAHVVAGCRVMWVKAPMNAATPVRILGIDTRADVALLWAKGLRGVTPLSPAATRPGDPLVLRGYPRRRGKVMDEPFDVEVTAFAETDDEVAGPILDALGLGPEGMSGGPLIDRAGRVVAMAVARRQADEEHVLAIPSSRLRDFLAYMGVEWESANVTASAAALPLTDFIAMPWPMPRPKPRRDPPSATVLRVGCSQ